MSDSNLPPEQWRPLFDAIGVEFGYRPLANRIKMDHTRLRRLLRGGGTSAAAVQQVADAFGVPAATVRELRGESRNAAVEPFTLPDDAGRLNDTERDAIRAVIRALLDAKDERDADEPTADTDSTPKPYASDEAQKAQEVKRFIVLRYDPARPGDGVVQGPTIKASDESDASEQLYRSLELAGVAVDPASDPLTTIARHGTATTLIRIVRDDAKYLERREHAAAKLRERGAQLQEGPAAELSQLLEAVDLPSMETDTVSDLLNLLQASLRNRRLRSEAKSQSDRDLTDADEDGLSGNDVDSNHPLSQIAKAGPERRKQRKSTKQGVFSGDEPS